jgi:hypothetical protein
MSSLTTFTTIHTKVTKIKSDNSLSTNSMAFNYFALGTILGLDDDDIETSITDGSSDGGIDAVYISGDVVNIFSFKYTDDYDKCNRNFPESELDKISVTMDKIFNKALKKKDVNTVLWEKINEMWRLLNGGIVQFRYYICSNKLKPISKAIERFEEFLSRSGYAEYYYVDQDDFAQKILERKFKKVNGEIYFVDKNYFQRSDGELKGVIATVAATDIIKLVMDPNDNTKILEDAFYENIRIYLKLRNRINKRIYETAISDDRYKFWYLNNGINIVCERCSFNASVRGPKVVLENLQIVNGGQTTHALFEAYQKNPDEVNDVILLVKICETKPHSGISEKISESTNSQNPIYSRDLHAQDEIQEKLEEQFGTLGYYYERKKNQYSSQSKGKRLDSELLGQLYLAYYLDMPSEAKNKKVLVFGEKYEDIFNENYTTAERMLIPYRVYLPLDIMKRNIQIKKRKKEDINEKESFVSWASFHLLNAVKIISENKKYKLEDEKEIKKAIKKAINLINEIVKIEQKRRGDLYSHDKFFKETASNNIIQDYVKSKMK